MVQIVGKAKEAVKRVTCRNCASILEYTMSETRKHTYRDISGCGELDYLITCPGCGKEIKVC